VLRGAGIGTHDEMLAVLRRIGIPIDDSIGVRVGARICLDREGRIVHQLELERIMSDIAQRGSTSRPFSVSAIDVRLRMQRNTGVGLIRRA
jgi:hypothetical protein